MDGVEKRGLKKGSFLHFVELVIRINEMIDKNVLSDYIVNDSKM